MLKEHFAATSGRTSNYDDHDLHLMITPRSNGDKTISISATLREDVQPDTHIVRHIPGITVIDGKTTTHQDREYLFTFLATTDPKFFPLTDPQHPPQTWSAPTTFTGGTYTMIPMSFVGQTFKFEHGKFISHTWADSGGEHEYRGRYQVDGERITVRFFDDERADLILRHLVVDDVDVLMFTGERPDGLAPFSIDSGGCYVLISSDGVADFARWWDNLLTTHPGFAKAVGRKPRAENKGI